MSTFHGLVAEFPDIRVDFFRPHPELRPPLACFLSHIHSDHLAGLENLRSPLYRYPCRINYASGILEARIQRYRHLKNLLKPIPLDTPTVLELEPGNHIQVTLFDANHCPGAVMFLLEGQGRAVLYTGDIRSEPWFVNAIARSPSLIEYSSGLKTLDTIYLDTSFIDDVKFPTKADGISELLRKISRYPAETIFHFQAWTYGYEDVWLALSKALGSKIHVDEYKMLMFRSLVATNPGNKFAPSAHLTPEAPGLVGFMCGNTYHSGCLTRDETVRLHSCEKGNYCSTVKNSAVVWIRPIITRLPGGQDVKEAGVGGGGDDLKREAELDYLSADDVESLLEVLCDIDDVPKDLRDQVGQFLLNAIASGRKLPIDLDRAAFGENNETDLVNGLQAITGMLELRSKPLPTNDSDRQTLPNVVTFPYSRHSSYPELCDLVRVFKPRDVWPCTVDLPGWLREGVTIERLFSQYCSVDIFQHDTLMRERFRDHENNVAGNTDSQVTASSAANVAHLSQNSANEPISARHSQLLPSVDGDREPQALPDHDPWAMDAELQAPQTEDSEGYEAIHESVSLESFDPITLQDSQDSTISEFAFETRLHAFRTVLASAKGSVGGGVALLSTTDNHSRLEDDLAYVGPRC
ncbi:beta-lactamase-like protein [Chaetomidium leptoderma]|uniref:Beta-lactamase-like protein n=1 Tax=Chaetomidium leptoderma TaxID=669021 RepID=A0AAN6VE70_9PEZI|nr:beta-lactamase-like protein [Chaetomidium leptoderma]